MTEHIVKVTERDGKYSADATWLTGSPPVSRGWSSPRLAVDVLHDMISGDETFSKCWPDDLEFALELPTDLSQPDEVMIQGKKMYRNPSAGWLYIVLGSPEHAMRLTEQPEPKQFLKFHRIEDPDADAITYTLVGKDADRKEAYFFVGSWTFTDPAKDIIKGFE